MVWVFASYLGLTLRVEKTRKIRKGGERKEKVENRSTRWHLVESVDSHGIDRRDEITPQSEPC